MELKIGVQDLATALGRSQGIVEKKSTMPILSHVLLEARKAGQLVVSATDLDLAVSSEHPCEVLKEGSLAVSARHLYEIVRALPEPSVTLKRAENNYLEVKSGSVEFRIVGLPGRGLPGAAALRQGPASPTVDPALLLEMIERTVLRGLDRRDPLQPERRLLRAAAGGRCGSWPPTATGSPWPRGPSTATFGLKRGVILPKKGLSELKKLLAEAVESGEEKPEAKLGFLENSAIFQRPGVVLVMRLIEGLFPDYKQVIPKAGREGASSSAGTASRTRCGASRCSPPTRPTP